MTQGFYEQLGVDATASAGQLRAAYTQAVSRLTRRRKALVEQGGDTAAIDLARAQLDEAMAVVSDPLRRRRYDALLRWSSPAAPGTPARRQVDAAALWAQVGDALVHPATMAALRLLKSTTQLGLGEIVAPASASEEPPTLVPSDDDLTSPRIARRLGPASVSPARVGASVAPRTGDPDSTASGAWPRASAPAALDPRTAPPRATTDVGAPRAAPPSRGPDARLGSSVPVAAAPSSHAPSDGARRRPERPVSSEDLARLVDTYGHTGHLLRAVREARGLSPGDLSESTRISIRYIEAIEADQFDALPSSTFVRGYVREIARQLRLDEGAVVGGYMRRLTE
jgi:hypothetical protein